MVIFSFFYFIIMICFLTKSLTLDILFSTAVTAVVVAKPVIIGVLPLTSLILVLRAAVIAKPVIIGILS